MGGKGGFRKWVIHGTGWEKAGGEMRQLEGDNKTREKERERKKENGKD